MTQLDLERSIAQNTGDSLQTVRRLGFQFCEPGSSQPFDDSFDLCIDCPFCGHTALQSSTGIEGLSPSAECPRCDIYFDYQFEEIYVAANGLEPENLLAA